MEQNYDKKISKKLNLKISQSIGSRIKLLRTAKNMTQIDLAEKLNTEANYISRIESAVTSPSLQLIYDIADKLDCSVYSILPPTKQSRTVHLPQEFGNLIASATPYEQHIITQFASWFMQQSKPFK